MRHILLVIFVLISPHAFAVYDLNDAEWAMLPEYCHHQGNVSLNHRATDTDRWKIALGADYEPIHHWCVTYVWMMRAQRAGIGSTEGKRLLWQAEGDTLYFIRRMGPDSPRASEAYTRLGEVSLLTGKIDQAEKALKRAHELDPKRWQAYFFWANYLIRVGKINEAKKEIAEGLEQIPENKALKALQDDIEKRKR